MLYLVPVYRYRLILFISTKMSTNNFHVTSLWRHKPQKRQEAKKKPFVFDHTYSRNIDFHRVCGTSFLVFSLK